MLTLVFVVGFGSGDVTYLGSNLVLVLYFLGYFFCDLPCRRLTCIAVWIVLFPWKPWGPPNTLTGLVYLNVCDLSYFTEIDRPIAKATF